jgi:hypothetical protein
MSGKSTPATRRFASDLAALPPLNSHQDAFAADALSGRPETPLAADVSLEDTA